MNLNFVTPQKALTCTKPRHMSHRELQSIRSFFL